jgi:hypothetical protein
VRNPDRWPLSVRHIGWSNPPPRSRASRFFSTRGTVSHTLIVLDVDPCRLNDRNTTFTAHQPNSFHFG